MMTRQRLVAKVWCLWLSLIALSGAGLAQLDGSCTVSVLNQTARVQEDGSWRVPNVPANMGPVRARVTCIENGIISSGSSEFFTIQPNRMNGIPQISLGGAVRTPTSLSLAAPVTLLTGQGQTVQLTATARFSDGSTADVTTAQAGTVYVSTNPGIASVTPDGLVTAHMSGRVLVSALHEAILASVDLTVQASGDSDGDGLADDWEMANGLDPNDPADAVEDPDGDGLPTAEEFLAGLDPFQADTDGDGLGDGREVNELGTNPLLADTDGDGLRDGLEIATGSDPLDPASFNMAAALESITMAPGAFDLFYNTVLGEASRQLHVMGRLIDGTSLDVTSRRYGTAYTSSDLAIVSFGAEDGRVYAGMEGQATVTAQVGGRSATAQVRVLTFSPTAVSYLPLPGSANAIALSGGYAYIASGAVGLQVVDVSNPLVPRIVGAVDTPGNANDVKVVGSFAYVADGEAGLMVVDVSQETAPRIVGRTLLAWDATDLVVVGNVAYVADGQGLTTADVSNPAEPFSMGFVETPGWARGVDVVDNLAVVAASEGGVQIVDVTDPYNPVIVGETASRADGTSNAADVTVRGRLAYISDGAEVTLGGLRVIDFRDPATPVLVGSTLDRFALTSTALERGLVLASDYFYANAVPIFTDAAEAPGFRGVLDFRAGLSRRDDEGHGLAVRDGYVYLVGSRSIEDNGTTGDSALHIGRYAIFEDIEPDGLPPAVELAPPFPEHPRERAYVRLKATATDDVRVESVNFLVNGQPVFTDFGAPYEYQYLIPQGTAQLVAGAVATDFAGRQTAAEPVTIPVTLIPEPVVTLLAPSPGQTVPEGRSFEIVAQASSANLFQPRVEFRLNGVLRMTDTVPPYRYRETVPLGVTELTVTATAFDQFGASQPATVTVPVTPDLPPTAEVLAPLDGQQIVEGTPFEIIAGATDDVGIREVRFFLDGASIGTLNVPPYKWLVTAPAAGETLRIHVAVKDTVSRVTTSPKILITAAPDPLTTIRGRAVDQAGHPLAGARVESSGQFTLSNGDGTFILSGLPSNAGGLFVSATAVVDGFVLSGSFPRLVTPMPGGIVEIGDLELQREDAGSTVTGTTVDEAGSPVAGATVKVYNDLVYFETATDADGRFTLAGIPSGDFLSLSASAVIGGARLRGNSGFSAPSGEVSDVGEVTLSPYEPAPDDPLTTVVGIVLSEAGEPVQRARLNVRTDGDVYTTVTAVDGTFAIPGVPTLEGGFSFGASGVVDGQLQVAFGFVPPNPEGPTDLGEIRLSPDSGGEKRAPLSLKILETPASLSNPALWSGDPFCPAQLPSALFALGSF